MVGPCRLFTNSAGGGDYQRFEDESEIATIDKTGQQDLLSSLTGDSRGEGFDASNEEQLYTLVSEVRVVLDGEPIHDATSADSHGWNREDPTQAPG